MIYVKENNKIITANILVHEDFKSQNEEQKYYVNNIYPRCKLLGRNIQTKSDFKYFFEEEKDEEYYEYNAEDEINISLALTSCMKKSKKDISNNQFLKEIEVIIDSNLPLEMKQNYLKESYFYFQDFAMNILSNLKLKKFRTYNIEELKKIVELCDKAQVFTTAEMIVSEENIEIAEENSKVLKLSKQLLELK